MLGSTKIKHLEHGVAASVRCRDQDIVAEDDLPDRVDPGDQIPH
jgi:hypothetical protein